ncbi:YhdT family protein [Halobacillus seohaensis]|uniref:YhdT family protein n=1 Tax=Halobacillus seohaensis TaxID=447421 RepID=A0ABW2EQB9_9BACI
MEKELKKKQDYRFKIANREALIGVALAVFNFIWWFAFAYGLGGRTPENYSYVFGLPAWFFYSCVLGFVVMTLLVIIIVKVWFVDVPLDEEEGE